MIMIILSKEQADKVRGGHGQYSALDPIKLMDGNYSLPADVLADGEFMDVKNFLQSLPQREITESEFYHE